MRKRDSQQPARRTTRLGESLRRIAERDLVRILGGCDEGEDEESTAVVLDNGSG